MHKRSELFIVLLIGAVQFVNILDFVMVMPMGPDFAAALGIPASQLGRIGGSYTAAAAVSGLVCSLFLDRFDRRSALAVAMLGLVVGTACGGLATGLPTLMLARVLAGAFGGPATSLSFSIIADVVPPERRGSAMGKVMGAFAAASVLGVPAGLELAQRGGWRLPFFSVAGLGLVVAASAIVLLPPLRGHLVGRAAAAKVSALELLSRPTVLLSYLTTALVMMAGFIVIPNISAYVQFNLGYPRADLKWLYLAGGLVSLAATQSSGLLVDRIGSLRTGAIGVALNVATVFIGFVLARPPVPILVLFMLFMLSMGFRNVAYNTLTTKVPRPVERARFMSLQSAVQHLSASAGAFLSSAMLSELPDHQLVGMSQIAWVSIGLSLLIPVCLWLVESRLQRGEQGSPVAGLAEGAN